MIKFKLSRHVCIATALVLLFAFDSFANVKLPQIFSDRMVLQQGIELPVWGWADPNETVIVSIGNNRAQTVADNNGQWKLKLAPAKAGGPFELIVKGNNTLRLSDVLIGEVWVCSGQSNMEMGVNMVRNGKQEAAEANYPAIRLFKVKKACSGIPLQDFANDQSGIQTWRVCNPKNISEGGWGGFSAAAYFFGRELHKKLGVPVGLIDSSWGGTAIKPWTPLAGFAMDPKFANDAAAIKHSCNEYKQAIPEAMKNLEEWLKTAHQLADQERTIYSPPWPGYMRDNPTESASLCNAMIAPSVPFAIRGAIWYQGESNCGERMLYSDEMKALIGGWRTLWNQGDFPFYFVQLAPYRYGRGEELAWIWQSQLSSLAIPNTGMVVTTDLVDNVNDVHPADKQNVGKRLALWALAKTYGQKTLICSGPLYKSMDVNAGKIRVSFDYAQNGLATRDGKEPTYFEIAAADMKFVKANARIDGSSVIVSSSEVKEPVAVRFGWDELAIPNLINKEGLPASPFSTKIQ